MDKINTVSSQAVLEVSSFLWIHARCLSRHWSIDLSKNDCSRPTAPDIDEPPFQFIPHYEFVCGRHDATWQLRSRNPQDWNLGCLESKQPRHFGGHKLDARTFGVSWRSSSTVAPARRGVSVHCPVGTHKVVTRHCAYRWQQCDVMTSWSSIEEVSKRYYQKFLLCNNNKLRLPHALQIYSTIFVKKCMRLHFSR